ncbi:MAG: SpoIIE family protein phosphatase [Sulfuricellaceae bacterium]|nr:SpoIIE family protein phosphatase [Sulfuricellaceae bacterium]
MKFDLFQDRLIDGHDSCKLLYNTHIDSDSAGILLRSRLSATARRMGFSDHQREKMELVAAELASNQSKYAGGRGFLQIWQQAESLDLFALDYGPGIQDLSMAQADGFSTANTLGKGLGSLQRLSDESGIYSRPQNGLNSNNGWHGTACWARFNLNKLGKPPENKGAQVEIGLFSRALSDERYNGDHIYLRAEQGKLRCLHLDGLGHGQEAELASSGLAQHLLLAAPITETLEIIDRELKSRRGAVAILAELDSTTHQIQVAGVGDMHALLSQQDDLQSLLFAPGILGKEHKTPVVSTLPISPKAVFITASDGIRRSGLETTLPGLFLQHPQLAAYVLGNVMGRVVDDQSICVIRTK